jgi:putative aldouronate transport system permease protein
MARKKSGPAYLFLLFFLTIICLSMVYPFLNLFFISISEISGVMASKGLMLYPKSITLYAYRYLIQYPYLAVSYANTVFITVLGTALALLMSTLGAYVLCRRDLPGRNLLTTFVIITMFIGGGLIPAYLNIRSLRLLNTLWVLILPSAISTWNMLLLRNFMMAIPLELTEAARIDGCGELRLLVRIVLPLSLPILATLALFYGVGRWNEYSGAIIYNSRQTLQTVQVIIRRMYDTSLATTEGMDQDALAMLPPLETIRAAAIIFTTLPILCVYPFLQKHFAQGIMVGSLKG